MEYGYNVFTASPLERQDDGWQQKVFQFSWDKLKTDSLGKSYPADIDVNSNISCSANTQTTLIADESDYTKSLKSSVNFGMSASHEGFSAAFTVSNSFDKTSRVF